LLEVNCRQAVWYRQHLDPPVIQGIRGVGLRQPFSIVDQSVAIGIGVVLACRAGTCPNATNGESTIASHTHRGQPH